MQIYCFVKYYCLAGEVVTTAFKNLNETIGVCYFAHVLQYLCIGERQQARNGHSQKRF